MQTLVTQAPSVCREPYIPTASSLPEGAFVETASVYLKGEVFGYRILNLFAAVRTPMSIAHPSGGAVSEAD